MIKYDQFQNLSVQATCFTAEDSSFTPAPILAKILGRYTSRYNGNIVTPDFGPNPPAELPRLVIESKDSRFKFQAGSRRIDSFWTSGWPSKTDDEGIQYSAVDVLTSYFEDPKPAVRVVRLALVITKIADIPDPSTALVDQFCNEKSRSDLFKDSVNFEVHNLKRYTLEGSNRTVNNWMRCKSVDAIKPIEKKVMLLEQDINTLQEEESVRDFEPSEIRQFFKTAWEKSESVFKTYFPVGDL